MRSPFYLWAVVVFVALTTALITLMIALRWINEHTTLVNPSPQSAEQLITELRRTGRPVQALYLVETAALADEWTGERLRLAGDLWRDIGDPYAAAAYWERAALETPTDLDRIRDLAETYVSLGEWTHAADVLARLHRLAPDDRWAAYQLGLIRAAVDPAALDLLQSAALEPAYAPIVNPVIFVLQEAGDPAETTLRIGIELSTKEQFAYAELAFSQIVGDARYAPLALAYSGWVRDMQGKDGGSDIRRAVRLAPDDARVRFLEGLHYRLTNNLPASITAFERSIALDPTRPEAYAELGVTYSLAGDRASAQYWIESALLISDNDPRFQVMLNQLLTEEIDLLSQLGIDVLATAEPTAELTPEATANPIAPCRCDTSRPCDPTMTLSEFRRV